MLRTDTLGRVGRMRNVCLLFFLSIFGTALLANSSNPLAGSIVCNDKINVTLDESDCDALILPDMIVEGPMNWLQYDYSVRIVGPYPSTAEVPLETVFVPLFGPRDFPRITEKGDYKVTITATGVAPSTQGEENWCWGNILVEDKTGPVIVDTDITTDPDDDQVCPHETEMTAFELNLFCTELDDFLKGHLPNVPKPRAVDQCMGDDITETFVDEFVSGDPNEMCDELLVRRVYTFDDQCGNKTSSCDYYYRITPLTVDEKTPIAWPHRTTVPCGTGTSPAELYEYFYAEVYDYHIHYLLQELIDGDPKAVPPIDPNPHATIADIDPDDIAYAAHEAHIYAIDYSYPYLKGTILDEGTFCNIAVIYTDETIPVCGSGCSYSDKIIRLWKVYNWCEGGELVEHTQIIEAFDTDGPEVIAEDVLLSVDPWGCFGDFYMPEPIKLYDACSDFVGYTVTGPPGANIIYEPGAGWHVTNAPKGEYTYTYHAYDCCENYTDYDVLVTIVDNTQPIAVVKQDIVISLINIDDNTDGGTGVAKLYATSLDNGSFDGCGPVHLEIRRDNDFCDRVGNATYNNDGHTFDDEDDIADQGQFVTFCCTDITDNGVDADGDGINDYALVKVWLRVWDDGDMNLEYGTLGDNYNEVWGYVRVEDKAQPDILCPNDITIPCSASAYDLDVVGEGIAINACGSASAEYVDEKELNGCNAGTIKRTWFVTGFPEIYCEQIITIEPSDSGTVTIWWPEDLTTDCTDDLSDEIPTWSTDNPCDLIAYTVDVDTFYFEADACYKIAKHWTVVNWCDSDPYAGSWSHHQLIKVIDEDRPFFTSCEDVNLEANDYNDIDQDGIICENNAVMLTAVADDVGNCASPWMKWEIQVDLNSNGWVDYKFSSTGYSSSDPLYVSPTLAGSQVKITLPDGIRGSMDSHSVKWIVSDGCGNIATCNTRFMVIDQKPPTPYCVNLSTALMDNGQVELWACDFDLGSFDNCTTKANLRFTFGPTPPSDDPNFNEDTNCSSRVFVCDDLTAQNPYPVSLYVWDEKDNFDFCLVNLTLVDNQGNCSGSTGGARADIGGNVFTEEGKDINNVMVSLNSALPESPNNQMNEDDGSYMFEDKTMYVDYKVSGDKVDSYLNGVSTLDLVLIQKHVLGMAYLSGPYKLIAADVNSDEKVSTIDLIELRKLILGIYEELPANSSWRFIPEAEDLNVTNPWPFTEAISIEELDHDMSNENMIGVKIGDVNSSATANLLDGDTDTRNASEIAFKIENQYVQAGQTVSVDFRADDFDQVYGYQFTMDLGSFELVDMTSKAIDLNDGNIATFDQLMTMSWNDVNALSSNEVLFTLELRATESTNVMEALKINSLITKAEAYVGEQLENVNVTLRSESGNDFVLYQNVPNPFNETTTIAFELPETSNAKLSVYDMTGKIVKVVQGSFEKGYNEITLESSALNNNTGIMYYELQSGNYTSTKKMIVIN